MTGAAPSRAPRETGATRDGSTMISTFMARSVEREDEWDKVER